MRNLNLVIEERGKKEHYEAVSYSYFDCLDKMPLQILNIVSFLFIVSMNKNMLITAQQLVLEPRDGHREVNDGCPCADLGAENDNDDY